MVFWYSASDRDAQIFSAQEGSAHRASLPYFVVGPQLSRDLYWMAISGTLSPASPFAAFHSRRPGILPLCRGTATFSSATLAMDPSGHYRCGDLAGVRFSHRGFRRANADAQFSSNCSADRQGDGPERSYLCLGKFAATLQFFRQADGDPFRELLTSGWRIRQPASRDDRQREESASGDVEDVSGRLGRAPATAHHRHVTIGTLLGSASNDAISSASRVPRGLSRRFRGRWRNNLSAALTSGLGHRA